MINLCDCVSAIGQESVLQVIIDKVSGQYHGEHLIVTGKDSFDIVVKRIDKNNISVSCDLTVDVTRTCSRCLENVNCTYQLSIFRNINTATNEAYVKDASEAEVICYIEDCNLDIDMLVLDELYTVIPMNVVCKDDCKGICMVCGTNLNESTCGCDQTVPDPRMAVFSDIFNQFKEV